MAPNYVILDCDGGSDDAWALLLLLKAQKEQCVILLGITICGCGNTTILHAARNMIRILRAYGRENVPIYLGADEALLTRQACELNEMFHGSDGFGDILPNDIPLDSIRNMVQKEHAVTAIHRLCVEHPQKVTIIGVGPLTNIALCYSMYGNKFADNIKDLYIMGGNHKGVGNITRSAEFNFYADPEAAHIVLSKSKCPITLMPWECCMSNQFFICIKWRLEKFGKEAGNVCEAIRLLNTVEREQWGKSPLKHWNPVDGMLVAVFLFSTDFIHKESMWHATVDLRGGHTRGQMVIDHLQQTDKYPKNIRLIELVNPDFFKMVVEWCAGMQKLKVNFYHDNFSGASKKV